MVCTRIRHMMRRISDTSCLRRWPVPFSDERSLHYSEANDFFYAIVESFVCTFRVDVSLTRNSHHVFSPMHGHACVCTRRCTPSPRCDVQIKPIKAKIAAKSARDTAKKKEAKVKASTRAASTIAKATYVVVGSNYFFVPVLCGRMHGRILFGSLVRVAVDCRVVWSCFIKFSFNVFFTHPVSLTSLTRFVVGKN